MFMCSLVGSDLAKILLIEEGMGLPWVRRARHHHLYHLTILAALLT